MDAILTQENRQYYTEMRDDESFPYQLEGYGNTNFTVLQHKYFSDYTLYKVRIDMTISQTRIQAYNDEYTSNLTLISP